MSTVPVHAAPAVWKVILTGALAGAMGWGIRGQYGHETGAMMAGLLVSLSLLLLLFPSAPAPGAMRAAGFCTIAIGIGGSMTYGQTVGLTHDPELVGNWAALRWGMVGLAVKGAIWIGFAGAFFGLGLSGVRYRAWEIIGMMLGMLALAWFGIRWFNEPFDPAHRILPAIYFSDDWRWEPDAALKPRREVWGGLLIALLGLIAYLRLARRDVPATRLAVWAMLGGALGFPLGQSLQAFHAWNPEIFRQGIWLRLDPLMNWWNWMETTFGAVMGGVLGLGLWLNRHRVKFHPESFSAPLPAGVAGLLLVIHLVLLIGVEFFSVRWIDRLYDFGLLLALIPIIGVAGDRRWPYWMLPVTVLPIAGKTVRELVYKQAAMAPFPGWMIYFVIPLLGAIAIAIWLQTVRFAGKPAGTSLRPALLFATGVFFGLNFAFFRFPWPWEAWTTRTPNALVYTVCAVGLTMLALVRKEQSLTVKEVPSHQTGEPVRFPKTD